MTSKTENVTLEMLGYNERVAEDWAAYASQGYTLARVIAEHREVYRVRSVENEYSAKVTGKRMFEARSREDYPAVGDWVAITEDSEGHATIHEILPRRSALRKKGAVESGTRLIAANIDVAFIVGSLDRDFNLNRIERYVALAKEGGVIPVIILNKIDTVTPEEVRACIDTISSRFTAIDIIPTSIITPDGTKELLVHIAPGKTYCFLGSSGVGKSSLINMLLKNNRIQTGTLSETSGRGTHTTTSREMYFLEGGGIVIDNPGMREVGMTGESSGIDMTFDDISALITECRFTDCTHDNEPGCAVLSALRSGALDNDVYDNYKRLKEESEFAAMSARERREKDKQFGKFIKQAKDSLKRLDL